MKTLAFGKAGDCIVFVSGKEPLDNREWDAYARFLQVELVPGARTSCLIFTEGSGPTAAQRQLLNEVLAPVVHNAKAAVMTSSVLARGIVTAMSWIYPVYKAFSPTETDEAIHFLGLAQQATPEIKQLLHKLRMELYSP
jgi:hypothetical protein